MPPKRIHFRRYCQIAQVLVRHGFGFVLGQLGLMDMVPFTHRGGENHRMTAGERLRRAMEELGPTFVKLGQILSTRPDLLPRDVVNELAKLQDQVTPFSFAEVRDQVERDLGAPLEGLFANLATDPLAAASIGQVHRATLTDGRQVVVKVQRPGIERVIEIDLDILFDLARLAQHHTPWGGIYNIVEMAEEFARTLKRELDYTIEGRNADRFRTNFAGDQTVRIPAVVWELSTHRVLTMEYVTGVKLADNEALDRGGYPKQSVAQLLVQAVFKQILVDGFFHADPHPGNLAVRSGPIIVFMDFGMVGYISDDRKRQFINLVFGLARRNSGAVTKAILAMGIVPSVVDMAALHRDVDWLRQKYYATPFSQIRLGEVVIEMLELAFKYRIRIPAEMTLMAKAIVTLEGVLAGLAPDLSVVEVVEPLARQLVQRRLQPRELAQQAAERSAEWGGYLLEAPGKLDRVLTKLAGDDLGMKIHHTHLEPAFAQLNRIVNRVAFAIVLLAFSIVMAGLVVASAVSGGNATALIWRAPLVEAGLLVAGGMALFLVWTIFRSGRL